MLHRVVPTLMRLMKIEKEAGRIVGVLHRIQHIGQLQKALHMPFGIDLHAADINRMVAILDRRLKVFECRLSAVEEQPLATVIQRPGPGHELAGDGLTASLDARDALKKAGRNTVLGFGAARFCQADIVKADQ